MGQGPQFSGTVRVLIVEDNTWMRSLYFAWLEAAPCGTFTVTSAPTLATAKAILARQRVDLILLDLRLPDGSGDQTLQVVREHAPETLVLILTGTMDPTDAPSDHYTRGVVHKIDLNMTTFYDVLYRTIGELFPHRASAADVRATPNPDVVPLRSRIRTSRTAGFVERLRRESRIWRSITDTPCGKRIAGAVAAIVVCVIALGVTGYAYAETVSELAAMNAVHEQQLDTLRGELNRLIAVAGTIVTALAGAVVFLFRSLQQAQRERVESMRTFLAKREEETKAITGALQDNTATSKGMMQQQGDMIDKLDRLAGNVSNLTLTLRPIAKEIDKRLGTDATSHLPPPTSPGG